MEKDKNLLGWRYLYYPFLHFTTVSYNNNYVLHVHSIQWIAGMGNTDNLHPNKFLFLFFSIPISRIKFLVLVCIDVFACLCRKVLEEEMAKK